VGGTTKGSDVVARTEGVHDRRRRVVVQIAEGAANDADVTDLDRRVAKSAARERFSEQREHLGVRQRPGRADELDAGLVVFALGAEHGGLLAEDRRGVRKATGAGWVEVQPGRRARGRTGGLRS